MMTAEQRLAWAMDYCRRLPLRPSRVRQRILAFLAAQSLPVSSAAIAQAEGLRGQCDPATMYRTLTLFADSQVVRQLRFHSKVSYFVLNIPGEFFHYFVCSRCGGLCELPLEIRARRLLCEITATDGCTAVNQGMIVFGLCQRCQLSEHRLAPTLKVTSRHPVGQA